MAGQQRLQKSELQFDKFLLHHPSVLEDKIQNPSKFLFRFSLGCYIMDQRSGPRHGRLFGRLAEPSTLTGHEPDDLIEMNNTEVTPIFFHRPSMTSIYDSAASIATHPQEFDLDDEQIRGMLASPLYLPEKKQAQANHEFITPTERELCVKLITFASKRGKTCSYVLTQKNVESRISLRQRRYSVGTSSSSRRK